MATWPPTALYNAVVDIDVRVEDRATLFLRAPRTTTSSSQTVSFEASPQYRIRVEFAGVTKGE